MKAAYFGSGWLQTRCEDQKWHQLVVPEGVFRANRDEQRPEFSLLPAIWPAVTGSDPSDAVQIAVAKS